MAWEISIPNAWTPGLYDGLETYDTKEEALAVAREHWGADEKGRVCIINELPDEDLGFDDYADEDCENV